MAKKVKFALEMANGAQVRSDLEELRKNFDIETIVQHFLSGKLVQWLEDRYYDEEAEKIKALHPDAPDFQRQLCIILGVEQANNDDLDEEQRARLEEKKSLLRQKTSDESVIALASKTAFNQEDLADLLDMGESTIYLCGKSFDVPIRMTGKTYIGFFGKPQVKINANSIDELREKQIAFENVDLDSRLQASEEKDSTVKSKETQAPPSPPKTNSPTIQAAKELLQDIQKGTYGIWVTQVFPFLVIPFAETKREIEKGLKQAAQEYMSELRDVLAEVVEEKIGDLKCLQEKYDEIMSDGDVKYLPIDPDVSIVSSQLKYALDETHQWRPEYTLGAELVVAARYGEIENPGFRGIFGGTDVYLSNENELTKIADDYYRKYEKHLESTNGGKMVKKYLESMCNNLKEYIGE